ncbi:MAG: calcium/sodium antiporter [cyanobacterium endosymbiont of Epithemia adnata isolate EadnSB Bon19]
MDFFVLGKLLAGLVLLVVGAEGLVNGASFLAASLGISPLVIGLTIVAYGTSSPEMAVAIQSSFTGQADIALGNIVGSNIFNVLVILGLSALAMPLIVAQQLIRLEVPIMIGISLLTLLFGFDGLINRSDGVILVIGGIIYTIFLIVKGSKQPSEQKEYEKYTVLEDISVFQWMKNLGLMLGGTGLLILGSRWLVESSTSIALTIGVSELVIGLTIVAVGTSLPELATSVMATLKGERDIAVGNVIGSNIFNISAVLGIGAMVSPQGIPVSNAAIGFDLPVMIAITISCLPIFLTGNVIDRWEGLLFVSYYIAYTTYLILRSTGHDSLHIFSNIMLLVVIPLTVLTLTIVTVNSLWKQR